jgi:hypothetical protein
MVGYFRMGTTAIKERSAEHRYFQMGRDYPVEHVLNRLCESGFALKYSRLRAWQSNSPRRFSSLPRALFMMS